LIGKNIKMMLLFPGISILDNCRILELYIIIWHLYTAIWGWAKQRFPVLADMMLSVIKITIFISLQTFCDNGKYHQ